MDSRSKELIRIGNKMFSAKSQVDILWQEIAENFYPERAQFTTTRIDGDELSDHLYASYPTMARRELGNLMSSFLRPQSQQWMDIHVDDEGINEKRENREFLQYLTKIQWRAMYDATANYVKASKQADHDFAAFGNSVKRISPNILGDGMLYMNYHLRDCAWSENGEGKVDTMFRKWKPTARQLKHYFPDKCSKEVQRAYKDDPEKQFECWHVVMPSRLYEYKPKNGKNYPYISLYVEAASETVLEEVGQEWFGYVVPRWQTVSDSPYGRSMAATVALPDARTMQVILRTLREAGEKFVDPPMVAVADAIRNDISLYAGGVTIADIEYDERLGDVLRPVNQDRSGMPIGFELASAIKEDLMQGFFLDKIQLPDISNMTATETRRRIQETIRQQSPLFEPIEAEDNTPTCEMTFEILRAGDAFPFEEIPEDLDGADIKFKFRSPLADMEEQNDAAVYMQVRDEIIMPAAQIDPSVLVEFDMTRATREAAIKSGWKAKWVKDPEQAAAERQQMQQQAQMQQELEMARQGGEAVEQGANAAAAVGLE